MLLVPCTLFLASCDDDDEGFSLSDSIELTGATKPDIDMGQRADTVVTLRVGNKPRTAVAEGSEWITLSAPGNVYAGPISIKVTLDPYTYTEGAAPAPRTGSFTVTVGEVEQKFNITQQAVLKEPDAEPETPEENPEETVDLKKGYIDGEDAPNAIGDDLTSKPYSWQHMKQSDHFFVFWNKYFGSDPNVAVGGHTEECVDIDDLLEKAEQFFNTNINKLKMATLGEGKSYLDDYKMQIFLMDPTNVDGRWQATGSGYVDKIGALWITPNTCQPVGSVIAHEIGHSFQYQTYADKLKQGAANDKKHGFRYGYVGPAGEGNGGCAYWEQCAQWQSFQDYPKQVFNDGGNYQVWLANCHRHFHHEWQRYASYWLQYYWVKKHNVECYGDLWTKSEAPEDAIDAYIRLFCGGDYAKCREELADYALRMATFDIEGIDKDEAKKHFDEYKTALYPVAGDYWQIGYEQCPGNTGFNVIALNGYTESGSVTIDFAGLDYGSALPDGDEGNQVDGDGKLVGTATKYNKVTNVAAADIGWRFGLVAFDGTSTRTYSDIGKANDATKTAQLTFSVPAGTKQLYLVVQGSTEKYFRHGWDEKEGNDVQCPYKVKFTGCKQAHNAYTAPVRATYSTSDATHLKATVNWTAEADGYPSVNIKMTDPDVLTFLGIDAAKFTSAINGRKAGEAPANDKLALKLSTVGQPDTFEEIKQSDGTYYVKDGASSTWDDGGQTFFSIGGMALTIGCNKGHTSSGKTYTFYPTLIYQTAAGTKYVNYTVNIAIP